MLDEQQETNEIREDVLAMPIPTSGGYSYRAREPIHITHRTNSKEQYHTMIAAATTTLKLLLDKQSLTEAKSFKYFRRPLELAYKELLPLLIANDPALKSNNPLPRTRDMHSLSVTVNPASAELIVRVLYQNSVNTHTVFLIRMIPQTNVVSVFADKLSKEIDHTDMAKATRL